MSVCTCSNPTPAGLLAPDHTVQQRGPWSSKGKGSHDWVFRRSIAWLPDSLSTLRSADYSNTTQDSLPVAGQALLDGLSTRKVPMKGFRAVNYISSPFPKLCLAQPPAAQLPTGLLLEGQQEAEERRQRRDGLDSSNPAPISHPPAGRSPREPGPSAGVCLPTLLAPPPSSILHRPAARDARPPAARHARRRREFR